VIAFDLDEALSFEGESGPYIQYAVVRANKILGKLQERHGTSESDVVSGLMDVPSAELAGADGHHQLWALVLEASRLDEIVEQVIRSLEFSVLAKYAFTLAQSFNTYYNLPAARSSIVQEEREDVRRWRAAGVVYVRTQLTRALELMGMDVPVQM
jgi:arginyl-tRNA synthetase